MIVPGTSFSFSISLPVYISLTICLLRKTLSNKSVFTWNGGFQSSEVLFHMKSDSQDKLFLQNNPKKHSKERINNCETKKVVIEHAIKFSSFKFSGNCHFRQISKNYQLSSEQLQCEHFAMKPFLIQFQLLHC